MSTSVKQLPTPPPQTSRPSSKIVSAASKLTPAGTARTASRGAWRQFRHLALFNRLALEVASGRIQNLLIECPPQHGKSEFWSRYFPAWFLGNFADRRAILASYGEAYARSWGRKSRDVVEEFGQELFGIGVRQDSHKADDWSIDGREGGMVTAGVGGPLTGRRGDVVIVDDPIKNHIEALSKARKDEVWDWWDSTLNTRLSENASKIVMHTRWAVDDLAGRIRSELHKTGKEKWTIIRLPAIAEEDEEIRIRDYVWTRKKGEVLCPELFSLETMEARKKKTIGFWWSALYQARPYPRGGNQLKRDWFNVIGGAPRLIREVRVWDLAASEDHNRKQTAGVRCGVGEDGDFYITHATADWLSSGKRDKMIVSTAKQDGHGVDILIEQEPGSGGKAQCENLERQLAGFTVSRAQTRDGDKETRADGMASYAENGHVHLVRGPWNADFLDQVERFPKGLIDMIDAAAHGFNDLFVVGDQETEIPDNLVIPTDGQIFSPGDRRIF